MHGEARRLLLGQAKLLGREIEPPLHEGAWDSEREVPSDDRGNCPVEMASEDPTELGLLADDTLEFHSRPIGEAVLVPSGDAGVQRRVVHYQYGRPPRGGAQRPFEPLELLRPEVPSNLAGHGAVEHDESERTRVGGVVHRFPILPWQLEAAAQGATVVVVPRNYVDWHAELGQPLLDHGVLLWSTVIGEIAGHDDGVRRAGKAQQCLERTPEAGERVDPSPGRTDVQVAQLHQDERPLHVFLDSLHWELTILHL